MKNTEPERFQISDFVPFRGLEQYVERNHLGLSEDFGGFGNPNANLRAYNRACFLQLYNVPFGIAKAIFEGIELLTLAGQ